MSRLAITGLGAILALGEGGTALAEALEGGRRGFVAVTDATGRDGWAARVQGFKATDHLPAMRARRLDRASLYAVAAAKQAIAAAGLAGDERLRHGMGVVVGTSSAGSGPLTTFLDALFRQSPEAAPPFEFPNTVANAPASHVSIELGLQGPNTTLAHSEAVAALGLVLGRLALEAGRCSSLLLGAVDEWNPFYQAGYAQIGALRDAPTVVAQGAPTGTGGVLLSEGAVMLVVEPEAAAGERGTRALASVRGAAFGSAPGEPYRWVADAGALARVIREALAQAGVDAGEVGSLFLGANGVTAMERAEAAALAQVFSESRISGPRRLPATGIKGALGERAVVGAATLAAAALARQRGVLPPFAGGALDDWPSPVALVTAPSPLPTGPTLVVLYGFGGNFGAVVLDSPASHGA